MSIIIVISAVDNIIGVLSTLQLHVANNCNMGKIGLSVI